MEVINAILWLRRLGIGRWLSAQEIIESIDGLLFPIRESESARNFFHDCEGDSLLLPYLPDNHPIHFDNEDDGHWNEIEELFPGLPIWSTGFVTGENEEFEFDQFDAIETSLFVQEIYCYFVLPSLIRKMPITELQRINHLSAEARSDDIAFLELVNNSIKTAQRAVEKLSPQFAMACAYLKQAEENPNTIGHPRLDIWGTQSPDGHTDIEIEESIERFQETLLSISVYKPLHFEFRIPSDLPVWAEDSDFLRELEVFDGPWWATSAFEANHLSQVERRIGTSTDEFQRWIRIFDSEINPSKWSFYFWERPLDATVWADSGFKPIEAALWSSIGFDPFDALVAIENNWEYSSIAPIVRAGMAFSAESVKLWGNAGNSSEILSAIDHGFTNISEYQRYKSLKTDYSTIQRFNEFSKEPLSIQRLSRAIALEQSWMDIKDAITWSCFDQPLSAVVEFKLAKQTPLQASKWIECGIPLDAALKWISLGVSQKDAMVWIEYEFDVNFARWFIEHGIDSPREGKLWLKYIPKKEVQNWKDSDFDPISASEWREIGFGPKTSLEWLSHGVDSAKEANKWLENNFELNEAIQWLARSISPENAKKWRAKSISPEIAQRREHAGIKP